MAEAARAGAIGELEDVDVRVSGRHMEIGDAFRERIEDRVAELVAKHYDPSRNWSATVTVEKSSKRFTAEINVRLDHADTLHAEGQAHDPHAAFDEAAERAEKRLRRHKRRLKEHRGRGGPGPEAIEMAYRVLTAPAEDDEDVADDFAPTVVAESVKSVRTMSVSSAVLALDMGDAPVLVFRNAKDDHVNVVYRRADGHVGWVDTSAG